jgi:hypothetical protein
MNTCVISLLNTAIGLSRRDGTAPARSQGDSNHKNRSGDPSYVFKCAFMVQDNLILQ